MLCWNFQLYEFDPFLHGKVRKRRIAWNDTTDRYLLHFRNDKILADEQHTQFSWVMIYKISQ